MQEHVQEQEQEQVQEKEQEQVQEQEQEPGQEHGQDPVQVQLEDGDYNYLDNVLEDPARTSPHSVGDFPGNGYNQQQVETSDSKTIVLSNRLEDTKINYLKKWEDIFNDYSLTFDIDGNKNLTSVNQVIKNIPDDETNEIQKKLKEKNIQMLSDDSTGSDRINYVLNKVIEKINEKNQENEEKIKRGESALRSLIKGDVIVDEDLRATIIIALKQESGWNTWNIWEKWESIKNEEPDKDLAKLKYPELINILIKQLEKNDNNHDKRKVKEEKRALKAYRKFINVQLAEQKTMNDKLKGCEGLCYEYIQYLEEMLGEDIKDIKVAKEGDKDYRLSELLKRINEITAGKQEVTAKEEAAVNEENDPLLQNTDEEDKFFFPEKYSKEIAADGQVTAKEEAVANDENDPLLQNTDEEDKFFSAVYHSKETAAIEVADAKEEANVAKHAEELAAKQAKETAAKQAEELAAKQAKETAAKQAEELAAKQAKETAAKQAKETSS